MAPESPGSCLPETSRLSLRVLPRASEKGPTPSLPMSRRALRDLAAGAKVLVTKALSRALSHGQVHSPSCVSGILGATALSPQARCCSAIAPHHPKSPVAPPWGPCRFRQSQGDEAPALRAAGRALCGPAGCAPRAPC